MEQHDRVFSDFIAWWERGNVSDKIDKAVNTANQMILLNKLFFGALTIVGTGAAIYKALH